jgi:hypothetical protein
MNASLSMPRYHPPRPKEQRRLQRLVATRIRPVRPEVIAKPQVVLPHDAVVLDDVDDDFPRDVAPFAEDVLGSVVRATVVVPKLLHALASSRGKLEGRDANRDVDRRLGGKPRNRGASDVRDRDHGRERLSEQHRL